MFAKYIFAVCLSLVPFCCLASDQPAKPGMLEGHLHIYSPKTVDLGDGNVPTVTPRTYTEYPLVILTQGGDKREVKQFTAESNGHYRIELPPGEYVLDVQDRLRKHVRAKPKPFTVQSGQTVRVDMDMDTGIR